MCNSFSGDTGDGGRWTNGFFVRGGFAWFVIVGERKCEAGGRFTLS